MRKSCSKERVGVRDGVRDGVRVGVRVGVGVGVRIRGGVRFGVTMAKMTPSSCRPGMGRLLGTVEPIASTVASKSSVSSAASEPTSELHWKMMPSAAIRSTRRCTVSWVE